MKATGIVRRIDDLGRVVIPKEIRRTLRIREGEPMEIFTGREGEIVLKKYSPIEDLTSIAKEYVLSMAQTIGYLVCISDLDQVIAAGGPHQQDYQGKVISKELEEAIHNRTLLCLNQKERNKVPVIKEEGAHFGAQIVCPIISAGDTIGSVVIINQKDSSAFSDAEKKLAQVAAAFLGRQVE